MQLLLCVATCDIVFRISNCTWFHDRGRFLSRDATQSERGIASGPSVRDVEEVS